MLYAAHLKCILHVLVISILSHFQELKSIASMFKIPIKWVERPKEDVSNLVSVFYGMNEYVLLFVRKLLFFERKLIVLFMYINFIIYIFISLLTILSNSSY